MSARKIEAPTISFLNPYIGFSAIVLALAVSYVYQGHSAIHFGYDKGMQVCLLGAMLYFIYHVKSGDILMEAVKKVEKKLIMEIKEFMNMYNPQELILGFGGPWGDKQRQILYDVAVNKDMEKYLYDLGENQGQGNLLIHATVKEGQKAIRLNKDDRKGHMLAVGATRAGKGVFAQMVINQLIKNRDEILIYMDPKSDNNVFKLLSTLAKKEGRPFYVISPAYENLDLCFNFLEDIESASDAAIRIKGILPSSASSEVWNVLAFEVLCNVITGMMKMKSEINLVNIYTNIFLAPKAFLKDFIKFMGQSIEGLETEDGAIFAMDDYLEACKGKLSTMYEAFPVEMLSEEDLEVFRAVAKFRDDQGNPKFSERTQIFGACLKALTEGPFKRMLSPKKGDRQLTWKKILDERAVVLFRLNVRKNKLATMGIAKMFSMHLNYVSQMIEDRSIAGEWPYPESMKINCIFDEARAILNDEMEELFSMSASSGIWILAMVQSVSQIYSACSDPQIADSIRGAFHHTLLLRIRDLKVTKEMSEYLGKVRVTSKEISRAVRTDDEQTTIGEDSSNFSETTTMSSDNVNLMEIKDVAMQPTLQGFLEVNGTLYHVEIPIIKQELHNPVKELGLKLRKGYSTQEDHVEDIKDDDFEVEIPDGVSAEFMNEEVKADEDNDDELVGVSVDDSPEEEAAEPSGRPSLGRGGLNDEDNGKTTERPRLKRGGLNDE